jgi:hypothetical protein
VSATRDAAVRRIVTERLLGSVRSLDLLPGGYSGGSVYHVRASLGGRERDLAVVLGRVMGAPETADGDATGGTDSPSGRRRLLHRRRSLP